MSIAERLAVANMVLSASTAVFLVVGRRAIRRGATGVHRTYMLAAFLCSTAFLVTFVTRFAAYGFQPYAGTGAWRVLHYVLLFAHEPIAVISVPMACVTLVLGLTRSRYHTELSRPTFWIWLISAGSGVLIYLLHAIPPYGGG